MDTKIYFKVGNKWVELGKAKVENFNWDDESFAKKLKEAGILNLGTLNPESFNRAHSDFLAKKAENCGFDISFNFQAHAIKYYYPLPIPGWLIRFLDKSKLLTEFRNCIIKG